MGIREESDGSLYYFLLFCAELNVWCWVLMLSYRLGRELNLQKACVWFVCVFLIIYTNAPYYIRVYWADYEDAVLLMGYPATVCADLLLSMYIPAFGLVLIDEATCCSFLSLMRCLVFILTKKVFKMATQTLPEQPLKACSWSKLSPFLLSGTALWVEGNSFCLEKMHKGLC